jgi:hypothetical protein
MHNPGAARNLATSSRCWRGNVDHGPDSPRSDGPYLAVNGNRRWQTVETVHRQQTVFSISRWQTVETVHRQQTVFSVSRLSFSVSR